ncbi:MAG: hypothetical protein BECKG1743D_GA0114223_103972 [Candidatus Kentron sp. G]|nr:MAG: hypothetical protein BECKG1743F_GA0114225_102604 [Candidatus Kentron sp. G]VFN02779.1 MAG: hypothetical protein BECKG1743D_GA0114223_103972 [Candidatus Kentron sp. G]VFN05019.1 MAG: hypothetical protein BECKG1743E_GA0114224_108111 [Candidatus Kentron sp. G]
MYAFHAVISIRYWFAIDIAIRYRYRSCPAFPIASSDIDSEPERTTTPVAPWLRYTLRGHPLFRIAWPLSIELANRLRDLIRQSADELTHGIHDTVVIAFGRRLE